MNHVNNASKPNHVDIFDTTLRDGSQLEGISLSVEDKLRIASQLDRLGVQFIEGGWPGASPKDTEFFAEAKTRLNLERSTLVAFGSTRRAGGTVETDAVLANLLDAETKVVCIVAKAWDYHVTEALRTTLDEALAMVTDSVEYLVSKGRRVFVDLEHFFDGYRNNADFSIAAARAAVEAGAEAIVLCDTNGGTLPHEAGPVVADVVKTFPQVTVSVHFHDDGGCAVANSLAGVAAGATQVQGCINGYGERTGNANLTTIIPNLSLKMGFSTIPSELLPELTPVTHHIAELVNLNLNPQQPYVGKSAFAHKAGLHTSAIARRRDAYEHLDPGLVGNSTRFVVSELAGRSTVALRAQQLGLQLPDNVVAEILDELKRLEYQGYHFEVADGSLELLLRRAAGSSPEYFMLESYRVTSDGQPEGSGVTEATVRVVVDGKRTIATAEGNGPVNALDLALREALEPLHPGLRGARLSDYRVRVLDTSAATEAVTRVLIDSTDEWGTWTTIGVHANIIEASCQALLDSIVIALLRADGVR